ncbi:MAG: histidine kinase dimerization/phosphoacceptor domain -containing protein [Sphingobacteriaceae bacterium]
MLDKDFHLLEELDNVSKMHFVDGADMDQVILDFSKSIILALKIERLNIWLFNNDQTALISIGEYDSRTQQFNKNSVLRQKDFPLYFEGLKQNKLIIAEDIFSHPLTTEFNDIYSKPNDIHSLLDIPLRVSGKLVGVFCFEKTGIKKQFSVNEQSFCLSISNVLNSILESKHRLAIQIKLENALKEKEVLISELNHRVKNNFAILISLLRLSKNKVQSNEAKDVLTEYEQRVFSMSKIYDLLNTKHYFSTISISNYLKELLNEFSVSYPQFNHCFNWTIEKLPHEMSSKKIINLGLVISEILLNSIKHAAGNTGNYELSIELKEIDEHKVFLKLGDNGGGFDFNTSAKNSSLGLPLIKDLIESMDIHATYPSKGNAYYCLTISV